MPIGIGAIIKKATSELAERGIKLREIQTPKKIILYGENFTLPIHNERDWFGNYIKDCLKRGMNSEDVISLSREAYALVRYKQALSGSSDGSQFGAFLASTHICGERAKRIYNAALSEFNSKKIN